MTDLFNTYWLHVDIRGLGKVNGQI